MSHRIVPTQSITSFHIHSIDHCHALLPVLESNMVSICFLGRVVFSFFFGFCSASISVFVFLLHYCLFVGFIIKNLIFSVIASGTTTLLTHGCPVTNSKVDLLAPCLYRLDICPGALSLPPATTPPDLPRWPGRPNFVHKNPLTVF